MAGIEAIALSDLNDIMQKMNPDFERPTIGFKLVEKKVEKTSL